jgi:hypothetical protein
VKWKYKGRRSKREVIRIKRCKKRRDGKGIIRG